MDKEDSEKTTWDQLKALWNSLPEALKLIGTLLGIIIALKALFPAAAMGIDSFNAGPDVIEPGDSSILSWTVSGASNVTIEPAIGTVSSNGSRSVSPPETTTYKLIAFEKGEQKVSTCTITVKEKALLINSFDASPVSIKPGESAVLNWHVAGAANVTIEPEIGLREPAGTLNVSPEKTTTYKLMASGGGKEDVAYCTVTVEGNLTPPEQNLPPAKENLTSQEGSAPQNNPPKIGPFKANPDTIGKGESSSLTWNVSSAKKVTIEPGIGTVGLTGSQSVSPDKTTKYTLTATNEFGTVEASKVVSVHGASESVSSEPLSTPKQLSPANGTEFDAPGIIFEWTDVSGAASYTIEIDSHNSDSNSWLSESSESLVTPGISKTSYSSDFPESGSYRWRVWAVDSSGVESKKSQWMYFTQS
jgi:hypothetical protein